MPYSAKARFPSWKYGNPSKITVYNQSGVLQKEVTNNYNVASYSLNNENNKSCKVEVVRPESAGCSVNTASEALPLSDFSWEYYYPVYGRAELVSTYEKNYTPSGLMSETSNTTTYNSDFLPNSSVTSKSNGDIIYMKNYYAKDYDNVIPAIQQMKSRNMISIPISSETWLLKADNSEYLLDATINEFAVLSNNEIKLSKVYKLEAKEPVLKSIIGVQNPSVLVRNNNYFKLQSTMIYNNGLLSEVTTPAGKFNSQVYDYLGYQVSASVANAHYNEISYSSFETNMQGNWAYTLAYVFGGDAVMGKSYFRISPSLGEIITTQWGSTKEAELSFWGRGALPMVTISGNASTPIKVLPNLETGWVYYEYHFTGAGTVSIANGSINNNLDIDELRLYPTSARMETIGYDPVFGIISECDENNRISYYEYDGLHRLKYIKDEKKNIIKKFCYNFAGEPESCLDINDQTPQWRDNGVTMCQPCPANVNYPSGVRLKQQRDVNPASTSFNQTQWIVDPTGICASPPSWIQTDSYCERTQTSPYGYTGNQVITYTDMNPCSQTFNQVQTSVISNPTACPIVGVCNQACAAPEYKCINGACIQGSWGIIKVLQIGRTQWECTYAYCFPDGTHSTYTQDVVSSSACSVTCQ
jgi:hypothetical protein